MTKLVMSRYCVHSLPNNHSISAVFMFLSLPTPPLPLFLLLPADRLLHRECVPAWRRGSVQDNSGQIMPTAGVVAAATAVTACYPAGEMAACVPLFILSVPPSYLPSFLPFFKAVSLLLLRVFPANF